MTLGLLTPGCVMDDLSECGASIQFRYTRNIDGIDKFNPNIQKVNLFIFDSGGLFLDEYEMDEKQLGRNHLMHLNLFPGTYDFVAWGNLGKDYERPVFVKGKTSVKDAVISLKRTEKKVTKHPGDLYFGSLPRIEILPDLQRTQVLTIDMIKDTKKIKIIAKGLPKEDIAKEMFVCRISSINGDYKFDNSINGSDRLLYIPQSSVDEQGQFVSEFGIMRDLKDGSTQSRLIFTYYDPDDKSEKELLNANLTEILLANMKSQDLDIEDSFEIELVFEFTNGSAKIYIKGWDSIDTGHVIG
jgi:hypothetical protein